MQHSSWLKNLGELRSMFGLSVPPREFEVKLPRGLYLGKDGVGSTLDIDMVVLPGRHEVRMVPCRVIGVKREGREMVVTVRLPDDWPEHLAAAVQVWDGNVSNPLGGDED
jgi:hypothetical protein